MTDRRQYPGPAFFTLDPDKKFKEIDDELIKHISGEIKGMLHASRDCLRNKQIAGEKIDTGEIAFQAFDGYYGEAFGMIRTLHILGYGYMGSSNLDGTSTTGNRYDSFQKEHNLRWWFHQLENEVLFEENWHHRPRRDPDYGRCEYCLARYGKDDRSIRSER